MQEFPRVIQRQRRVTYAAYASFPTDNKRGDLAFATDRLVLYRWSGSAWQAITFASSSGTAAAIPTAGDLPNGSLYFETDTGIFQQVQAGAWAVVSRSAQEFFSPATDGTDVFPYGDHPAFRIDAAADKAYIEFTVPSDFTSIVSAVVVRIAGATATHRLNYNSDYGAQGEAYNVNSESLADQDTAETQSDIYEQDISGILSSLAPDDYVGIEVIGDAVNVPSDGILGVRFSYI